MARNFVRASNQFLWVGSPWITTMPFTASLWIKPTLVSGQLYVAASETSVGTEYYLFTIIEEVAASNVFGLRAQVASPNRVPSGGWPTNPTPIVSGAWNHLAFSCTTVQRVSFVNGGKLIDTATQDNFTPGTLRESSIGSYVTNMGTTANFSCDGAIAEFAIWQVALTDDEFIGLSKGVSPLFIRRESLVSHYPLYGNNNPETDRWKYDAYRTLTVNGPTKAVDHPRIYLPWQSPVGDQRKSNSPWLYYARQRVNA